jgi:restriction endonuclease S subunit
MPISEEQRIQKNLSRIKPLSVEKLKQLQEIELRAVAKFYGNLDELESALGFLRLGFHYGWKPMAIVHSKKTFKKYEQILEINARELFPEETPTSERSNGYAIAKKLSNFWKAVSGDTKVENRREITSL